MAKFESGDYKDGIQFNLDNPINESKQYDQAIRMLEYSTQDSISLEKREYENYVEDKWHWARQVVSQSAAYGISTRTTSKYADGLDEDDDLFNGSL